MNNYPQQIIALEGDASNRRYFRMVWDSGATAIVMKFNPQDEDPQRELSFVNIQRYLQAWGINVPRIYRYERHMGLIFIEDLGENSLEKLVKTLSKERAFELYKKAIHQLIKIQEVDSKNHVPDSIRDGCIALERAFDVERFLWELNFFLKHYVIGLKGERISEKDKEKLDHWFTFLAETLTSQEKCLTHRDFHSRNLMVLNGDIYLLDFQDARLGPHHYDLASLLRDSYITLKEDMAEELMECYITRREKREKIFIDRQSFREIFDLTSIQRNLKAIGTFAYQYCVKGNKRYLEAIPPTIRYVKMNLERYSYLKPFKEALLRYI